MLQRFQTLFLIVVVISMVMSLLLPIWNKVDYPSQTKMELTAFSLSTYQNDVKTDSVITVYLAVLAVLAAVVAGYSITRYDSRMTQIKMGALNSLLMAALLLTSLYLANDAESKISPDSEGNYLLGFFAPVIGLICNILANRFIRRDEMLVRSAERLR